MSSCVGGGVTAPDGRFQRALAALPLTLLVVAVVLHVALDLAGVRWAVLLPLALATGVWSHAGWLWITRRGERGWPVVAYLAGLWILDTGLVLLDPIFVLAAITGLIAAPMLTLDWRGVPGVLAFSVLVNFLAGGTPDDSTGWAILSVVVVVQTFVIGSSGSISRWVEEQSERRRQAIVALEAAAAENASLQAQLVTRARDAGAAAERVRLAREIHDTLAQGLVGVLTQVEAAQRCGSIQPATGARLDRAAALARSTLADARRSLHELRPAPLEDAGLVPALDEVVSRWAEDTGTRAELVVDQEPGSLPTAVGVVLLRAAQEALANVARHARAQRVVLTLAAMEDVVVLDVRDDGRGFDPLAVPLGCFGLTGLRERVASVGGAVEIESARGEGTALSVRIPRVPDGPEAQEGPAGPVSAEGSVDSGFAAQVPA